MTVARHPDSQVTLSDGTVVRYSITSDGLSDPNDPYSHEKLGTLNLSVIGHQDGSSGNITPLPGGASNFVVTGDMDKDESGKPVPIEKISQHDPRLNDSEAEQAVGQILTDKKFQDSLNENPLPLPGAAGTGRKGADSNLPGTLFSDGLDWNPKKPDTGTQFTPAIGGGIPDMRC